MCTGLEIAALVGTAASLAGTGASIAGQQQQKSAMDRAVREQLAQQEGLQKKATSIFQQNVAASEPKAVQRQIDTGALNAKSLYEQLQSIPLVASDAVQPRNDIVDTTRANQYAGLVGGPASRLQGLNQYNLQEWIRNLQTNARLGAISNQSQLAASTLQSQLGGNAGMGLQGFGSLLQSAGGLAGTYGAVNGAFAPTTPTATNSQVSNFLRTAKPINSVIQNPLNNYA